MVVVGAKGKSWMVVGSVADPNLGSNYMQLCFSLYFCVHFLTGHSIVNRIDIHCSRKPTEFKHTVCIKLKYFGLLDLC